MQESYQPIHMIKGFKLSYTTTTEALYILLGKVSYIDRTMPLDLIKDHILRDIIHHD